MKIKLCRVFNLFNKPTIIYSLLLLLIVMIIGIIYENLYYLLIVPAFGVLYCYNYSSFLNIENRRVTYRDFQIIGNIGKGMDFKYIYSETTIEIESIKFCQNVFEKIFNAGHIQFIEKGNLFKHTIYGITHFDIRKQEISEFFK